MTRGQAKAAAQALANGIGAAATKITARRRLLAESSLSPVQAFLALVEGAYDLSNTQAAGVVLDGTIAASGTADMCVAPGLQSGTAMDGLAITYDCDNIIKAAKVGHIFGLVCCTLKGGLMGLA